MNMQNTLRNNNKSQPNNNFTNNSTKQHLKYNFETLLSRFGHATKPPPSIIQQIELLGIHRHRLVLPSQQNGPQQPHQTRHHDQPLHMARLFGALTAARLFLLAYSHGDREAPAYLHKHRSTPRSESRTAPTTVKP